MSKNGEEVNLLGYQMCQDHDSALEQAFKSKPDDKVAALLQISLDSKAAYLPLKNHLTNPEAQHQVILQDGLGLKVVACAQSDFKKKVKGGEMQTYKLIELNSRPVPEFDAFIDQGNL